MSLHFIRAIMIHTPIYVLTPILTWLTCGTLKFLIHSIRTRTWAFHLIGHGGMPSNHTAMVTSMVAMMVFTQGLDSPMCNIAITMAMIVGFDAHGLRNAVGQQAKRLNLLTPDQPCLKMRIGHTYLEMIVGFGVGLLVSTIMVNFFL